MDCSPDWCGTPRTLSGFAADAPQVPLSDASRQKNGEGGWRG
jgi:hypothetical protein